MKTSEIVLRRLEQVNEEIKKLYEESPEVRRYVSLMREDKKLMDAYQVCLESEKRKNKRKTR